MAQSRINIIEKLAKWLDGKEDFEFEYEITENKFTIIYPQKK